MGVAPREGWEKAPAVVARWQRTLHFDIKREATKGAVVGVVPRAVQLRSRALSALARFVHHVRPVAAKIKIVGWRVNIFQVAPPLAVASLFDLTFELPKKALVVVHQKSLRDLQGLGSRSVEPPARCPPCPGSLVEGDKLINLTGPNGLIPGQPLPAAGG